MLENVQRWYEEAVAEFGDDWLNIERYVQQKLSNMNPLERARLLEEFLAIQPAEAGSMH